MSIIAVDLDGTLLNDKKKISNEDKETMKKIYKNNNIIIASGRSHSDINKILVENGIEKFVLPLVICRNGQEIYNINSGSVLSEEYMQFETIKKIIKVLEKKQIYWYCLSDGIAYCKKLKLNCLNYKINGKFTVNLIKDINELEEINIEKFVINEISNIKMRNIKKIIEKEYDVKFMKYDLNKKYKEMQFIQNIIMNKGVNKYTAVIKLKELLDLSNSIISFGDGFNDYELIKQATFGICMENGNEKIKNIAKFITKSNNDSGFSFAMNYLQKNDLLD